MITYTLDQFRMVNDDRYYLTEILGVFTSLKNAHKAALHVASLWKDCKNNFGTLHLNFWDTDTQARLSRWIYTSSSLEQFNKSLATHEKMKDLLGEDSSWWCPVGDGVRVNRSRLFYNPTYASEFYIPLPNNCLVYFPSFAPPADFDTDIAGLLRDYLAQQAKFSEETELSIGLYRSIIKTCAKRAYVSTAVRQSLEICWDRLGLVSMPKVSGPEGCFAKFAGAFLFEDTSLPPDHFRCEAEDKVDADEPVIIQETHDCPDEVETA